MLSLPQNTRDLPAIGMLRGLVKSSLASTVYWTGMGNLLARRANLRHMPLVIGYHRIVEDFRASAEHSIPPMLTSLRTFERQLDWLGRRFKFVTLDEVAAWIDGVKQFKRPVAAITFDDGYADLYHNAFPLLQRKGIPAAVFVVTRHVGTPQLQLYDELYLLLSDMFSRRENPRRHLVGFLAALGVSRPLQELVDNTAHDALGATWVMLENLPQAIVADAIEALRADVDIPGGVREELRMMDWSMLRELARSGITVGSHTRTHVRLTLESRKTVAEEIGGSREELEHRLGRPVEHFAYPSGAFNTDVVNAVAEAGYRCAYTACRHRDRRHPALTIPRRLWWENSCLNVFGHVSPAVMSCQVSGVFDAKASCGQTHHL